MTAGHSHDYLNKLELAERLGITRRKVEEMMRRRKIPFIALGHRTVRFFWPAVEKALGRLESPPASCGGRKLGSPVV